MEKDLFNDGFEELLKEKADQFRMYPSKRVWNSIYNNLHPSRRWPSMIVLLLLISSLSFIGYMNTGENSITRPINNFPESGSTTLIKNNKDQKFTAAKEPVALVSTNQAPAQTIFNRSFPNNAIDETDYTAYTLVESNRPDYHNIPAAADNEASNPLKENTRKEDQRPSDIVQAVDSYIRSNQLYADVAKANSKNRSGNVIPGSDDQALAGSQPENENIVALTNNKPLAEKSNLGDLATVSENDKKAISLLDAIDAKKPLTNEEKAWIENYKLENNNSKLKNRLQYQVYLTPAVNYRKLSSKTKGSASAFATADINQVISQKPGFGMEAGVGLTYKLSEKLQLKTGLQLNYTNYNIDADKTNHPILTTIIMNDPYTGYSYAAARTSTTSNIYSSAALQPVTLHNRTYQLSVPVGLVYKLSSKRNVDWFAGASAQPTYVFGGNAHIISSDLKSYVSDPSSIRSWNLNLGFETYMNFNLGTFNLQVGPQVRYQVYSTYRKDVALIEKPYAVGLKFGLTKGF